MLAAMAKTAPPVPERRWWKTSTVRWLAPIAVTSAVGVIVWMRAPLDRSSVLPRATVELPAALEKGPADVASPAAGSTNTIDRFSDSKPPERRREDATKPGEPAAAPSSAPSQPLRAPIDQFTVSSAPPPAERNASPSPAAPVQSPLEVRSEAARELAAPRAASAQGFFVKLPAVVDVVSPDRNVRWRIADGTRVERSTDGGATWQPQATGTAARLTAGVAVSPTICWIVGSGGVVLLSKDGRTWQRVAFPETVDLSAIRATDASTATVTAVDERMFTTTDGGTTWRQ
jgi:hypothetical protein